MVFYFVLNPILHVGSYHGGSLLDFYLHTIGAGPLWFVLALLAFDACYAAFRRANSRASERKPLTYRTVIGFVVAQALATFALRTVIPIGFWVPVVDFPTSAYLPQYVSFFVLGTVAYRRGWFDTIAARMGWAGLGLAIGATLLFLPLALTGEWSGHGTLSSLFYALWDSSFAVGVVLALLTLFSRKFNSPGRLGRLSGRTFTMYVIHAFVVTAAGYALSALNLPTLAKFAIAAVVVLPACFLLAGRMRRVL